MLKPLLSYTYFYVIVNYIEEDQSMHDMMYKVNQDVLNCFVLPHYLQ